jgi:RNA-directed DNA polymerase
MLQPIPEQGRWLNLVITGYYAYHAVPTNSRSHGAFRDHVVRLWGRTLRRRSQKHALTWERMGKVADDWLPLPRILHPWPSIRFAVKHLRQEPDAGNPLVRICAGGVRRRTFLPQTRLSHRLPGP